jgi:ribosomal RNA-processing protein 1
MSNSGRSSNKSRASSSPQVKKTSTTSSGVEEGMMTPVVVEGGGGGKVMLQEEKEIIAFARRLAANEKRDRDQALKRLEAWMTKHKQLSERDLLKIWKGLFYCMWMSDKAQVQQELGRAISRLVHCFGPDLARAHLFVATFYRTVRREWTGLDQHRLDKFYSFMRSMLRECLAFAQQRAWSPEALAAVVLPLDAEVLVQPWPNGLRLHLCDLILPELAKVGGAGLTAAQALAVLQPFLVAMAASSDVVVAERARARVLLDLIEAKKKQRTKGEAMDEDNEGEEDASMFDGVDLEALQATVFDLAAAPETREKYRAGLYDAHKGLQGLTGKKRADATKAVLVSLPKPSATSVGRKGKKAGMQEEEEEEDDDWMDEDEDGSGEEESEDESEEEEEEKEEAFAAPVKGSKKRKTQGEIAPAKQQQQQQQQQKGGKKQAVVVESKKAKKEEKKTATPTPTPVTSESKPAKGALGDKAEKKAKVSKKGGEEEATATMMKKKGMPPATQPSETKSSSSKRNAENKKASTTTTTAAATTAAKKTGSLEQGTNRKSAEVKVPTGGKGEAAATQKTAAAAKKTKVVVDGTATEQAAPSPEKKAKKQSSAAAAAPAAPAAEPMFIPSKKFAGGKSGYAFKKGREGVGYYIDPVQRGGGAVASVGGAGNAGSSKKVRWGKVQVKLFNKHASPADGKGNTVSFMGGGAARGGKGKQGGRGGRGGGGRGGGRQQNNNRRKAVSYF